ncbi:uncharacterized protein METZ01_LOCUS105725 [marine metagenome]|uniref:Tryptophan synthase beta chain-like PALP domain-containing protein n=1 Tax=marine metagenome TaxID=408172 RepID=A0A381WKR0_9ZZZZ
MPGYKFSCSSCGWRTDPTPNLLSCTVCESPLDVEYMSGSAPSVQPKGWRGPLIPLPISSQEDYLTLGEGNTPVVNLERICEFTDVELFAKLEFLNPTGSFKDRGTSIMISVLKSMGITELVEDSSGNAGASVSAYSALAGITANIFAPTAAPGPKISQIKVYGAETHLIEGTRDETTEAAIRFASENSLSYASHNLSPFFIEGTKIFAYEVFEQFSGEMPTDVVIPVGNGSLYLGMWKGLVELKEEGLIGTLPKLHCVQAKSVMPVAAAYKGQNWDISCLKPTIAGGIAVATPPRLHQVIQVLQKSGGTAITVSEEEIGCWHTYLPANEGLFAEPTSAAAFAGAEKLVESGIIPAGSRILIPVTGFGLKDFSPV